MCKRLHAVPVLVSLLVSAFVADAHGRAISPSDEVSLGETTVDVVEYLYSCLRENGQIKDSRLPYEFRVQKVQGKKLIKLVLIHKDSRGKADSVTVVEEAELKLVRDKKLLLRMHHGTIRGRDDSRAEFKQCDLLIDLPKDFGPK